MASHGRVSGQFPDGMMGDGVGAGSGRKGCSKKHGAGGKGTWGAWDQYDMEMDMSDDLEQDEEDAAEFKAPAFNWMMDYAALITEKKVANKPAQQPNIHKMINDLIKEFSEHQTANPKLRKKNLKHADNNKQVTSLSRKAQTD
eukprot:1133188-Pyramimonas_sp.AAC.1